MSSTAHSEHAFLHADPDTTAETSISEPHPAQPPSNAQSDYGAHVDIPPSPSPGARQPRLEPNDLSKSFVEPQHKALSQSHGQHGAENMESTEESALWPTHLLNPNTHWVANVQGGMVEFEAGELGLGLGGQGREFFMDDSFWRGVEWMYM